MITIRVFICTVLLLSACTDSLPLTLKPLQPNLILHRGDSTIAPGNTLKGIWNASNNGFRNIEVDVREASDGNFFLFHDGRIRERNSIAPKNLLGNRSESVDQKSLSYLCEPTMNQQCAPLFSTVLQQLSKTDGANLFLDIKNISPVMVDKVLTFVESYSMSHRIVVQCPTIGCSRLVKVINPEVKVLIRIHDKKEIAEALSIKPYAIQVDLELLNQELSSMAHKQNVLIVTKAVDTDYDTIDGVKELISKGADLILSDLVFH